MIGVLYMMNLPGYLLTHSLTHRFTYLLTRSLAHRLLYKEINYNFEADNAIRFKTQFAGTSWIKVPEVYKNLTT